MTNATHKEFLKEVFSILTGEVPSRFGIQKKDGFGNFRALVNG